MKRVLLVAILMMFGVCAQAQRVELESLPGYVDFGALDAEYGEPKVMINIGGSLLRMIGALSKSEEEAELLQNLDAVRVNVFATDGNSDPALSRMAKLSEALESQDWELIVTVNEEDSQVRIFVKTSVDRFEGFVVMAVEDDEAVFINILGDIDPERLGDVMDKFDVDVDLE